MVRRESHALSFDQSFSALASLQSPAREMVLFAILTSMNIAEICGLQWKRVNLNEQFTTVDGESLPPLTIAVRAQWYRGEYGSVKAKSRRRNLPIPVALRGVLGKAGQRALPDDAVQTSFRVIAPPIDAPAARPKSNLRRCRPASRRILLRHAATPQNIKPAVRGST